MKISDVEPGRAAEGFALRHLTPGHIAVPFEIEGEPVVRDPANEAAVFATRAVVSLTLDGRILRVCVEGRPVVAQTATRVEWARENLPDAGRVVLALTAAARSIVGHS